MHALRPCACDQRTCAAASYGCQLVGRPCACFALPLAYLRERTGGVLARRSGLLAADHRVCPSHAVGLDSGHHPYPVTIERRYGRCDIRNLGGRTDVIAVADREWWRFRILYPALPHAALQLPARRVNIGAPRLAEPAWNAVTSPNAAHALRRGASNGRIKRVELAIRIQVEELPEGLFLATSDELPGLVAQGRTVAEALEIARRRPETDRSPARARRRLGRSLIG